MPLKEYIYMHLGFNFKYLKTLKISEEAWGE
jgi:hypothetical protein